MLTLLKTLLARLPYRMQTELKRIHYRRLIKNGCFVADEPEYKILHNIIKPGDWVLDIGANIGSYTKRFSELVGPHGRVIAFEPVPTTFSLLSANAQLFAHPNVSLINAAVSDKLNAIGMSIPKFKTGLPNYYEAHISSTSDSVFSVLTIPLDFLCISQHIALVKIDVEEHEAYVLAGMMKLIEASHPVLIIETGSNELISDLTALGYMPEKFQNSPNVLFKPIRS